MNKKPRKPTQTDLETLAVLALGHSRLGDISSALDFPSSTTKDRLERCRAKGLAEIIKGGRDWRITPEGRAALENATQNPPPETATDPARELPKGFDTPLEQLSTPRESPNWGGLQALAGWSNLMQVLPLPEFRAALRLVLAVALLRNRAPKLSPMPWIGLYGSTGTGKSTIARAIVGGHYFQVGTMTAGEAMGRRAKNPPYKLETAPRTLAGAVTDLDELAEASETLKTALYALMQRTDQFVTIEGDDLENRAAIVATWNPTQQPVPLPVGALRRGLLLDTTPFKRRLEKAFSLNMIGVDIRATLEQHPEPWLDIHSLPEPCQVDKTALEQAQRTLYSVLKNPSDHPLAALSGIGAAYAVLFALTDQTALHEAVADMAALAATRGETIKQWREVLQQNQVVSIESSEPDEVQTDAAALVRFDLELTKQRAHTVQRAANAREPIKQYWTKLAANEREVAAPILAGLEAIGQGSPNANPERLEALCTELDTLEHQALNLAYAIKTRLENDQNHATAQKQNEQRQLENAKQEKIRIAQRIKNHRQSAKVLRQAVTYKDSAAETDRAKHRKQVIAWCYQTYLEYRNPPQLPSDTGQGWLADIGRRLENNRRALVQHIHERTTGRRVPDLDTWMLEKATALENEASALERGHTRALAPVQNARALPASAPAQGLDSTKKRWL